MSQSHPDDHSHPHARGRGIVGVIGAALHLPGFGHGHEHGATSLAADRAVLDNDLGIRTVWLAFVALGITTALQIAIYLASGSVALLADTVHNLGDALNSIPLLIALYLARRAATRRYTYGFGRAEDIAGIVIGLAIVGISWTAAKAVWYRLMDGVDPSLINRMEHYASEVEGVDRVVSLRAHWVGHRLFAELTLGVDEGLLLVEGRGVVSKVRQVLHLAVPHLDVVHIEIEPRFEYASSAETATGGTDILPPRYQQRTPSAAPMGAVGLTYADDGQVAWDEVWTDFCDLALAGGPPHRGTLLEPVDPKAVTADPAGYERTIAEIERGLAMVTGLPVVRGNNPGWLGLACESEAMALWLLRAIVVENISIRREGTVLYFPAGPDFRLDKEIKNIVTVFAKTIHYWREHVGEGATAGG